MPSRLCRAVETKRGYTEEVSRIQDIPHIFRPEALIRVGRASYNSYWHSKKCRSAVGLMKFPRLRFPAVRKIGRIGEDQISFPMRTKTLTNNNKEKSASKFRILLVEDDADDYVIIQRLLSRIPGNSFTIDWVTDYHEAIAALKSDGYDLCLLDYRLGAYTGFDLLNQIRSHHWDTPVIFLTGQGTYDIDIQAMRSGASDYLVKDHLTTSLLERSIRYAIEREKSRKALKRANEDLELRVQKKTANLAEANAELQRESEKVKLFSYSVSHDLKNPAISLYGLTKRLLENYGEVLDEKGQTYCRHIMQSAQQIATLTERINIFIASKEAPVKIEEVDLESSWHASETSFGNSSNHGISVGQRLNLFLLFVSTGCLWSGFSETLWTTP